jgi:hypothetical protein
MILARARNSTIYDLLAPPLILLTPFISFITHNDYSYSLPELWLCVAGLIALGLLCSVVMTLGGTWLRVLGTAALLTLFVDLQFEQFDSLSPLLVLGCGIGILLFCGLLREHLSRITVPVFATMLAASLAFPGQFRGRTRSSSSAARHSSGKAKARPADNHSPDLRRVHWHRRNSPGGSRGKRSQAFATVVSSGERFSGVWASLQPLPQDGQCDTKYLELCFSTRGGLFH